MGTAVEELLRYDSPVQSVTRRAKENVELDRRSLKQGHVVYAVIGAANRDPRRFEDPDKLDTGRQDNGHLGLGDGIHFCLGAPLARAEAQIGISTLLRRYVNPRLSRDEVEWGGNFIVRGVARLPVEY